MTRDSRGPITERTWNVMFCVAVSVLLAFPALAEARSHNLRVKTCNDIHSGTENTIYLKFCQGMSNCTTGESNAYNLDGELKHPGTWSYFDIPLGYEPTTMVVLLSGGDAWCIEEVIWNNSTSLLGRGARIYLDGDKGFRGCNYGVHHQTGRFYPCRDRWRFFNLRGKDGFMNEIAVKQCKENTASTAIASLCSESMCSDDVGDVAKFNLTLGRPGNDGWIKKRVKTTFNPVAMKLRGTGNPWCANDIAFNDFRLVDHSSLPVVLSDEKEQFFYSVQMFDIRPLRNESSGDGTASTSAKPDSDADANPAPDPHSSRLEASGLMYNFSNGWQRMVKPLFDECRIGEYAWAIFYEVATAIFTSLFLYAGVILRQRILSRRKKDGERDGAHKPLCAECMERSAEIASIEDGDKAGDQTSNVPSGKPGLRLRKRGEPQQQRLLRNLSQNDRDDGGTIPTGESENGKDDGEPYHETVLNDIEAAALGDKVAP